MTSSSELNEKEGGGDASRADSADNGDCAADVTTVHNAGDAQLAEEKGEMTEIIHAKGLASKNNSLQSSGQTVAPTARNDSLASYQEVFGYSAMSGISDLPDKFHGSSGRQRRFKEEEEHVRKQASRGLFFLAFINIYASVLVFAKHLLSIESVLSITLSVLLTVYTYHQKKDDDTFDASTMDWVLLSFAVITPMSASVSMAFSRREKALALLAVIRATMVEIYCSHACWDWKKVGKENTGRAASTVDWLDHADSAMVEILGICHILSRLLQLPTATRARHRATSSLQREADDTLFLASKLYGCMFVRFGRLTDLCEILKEEGLPPNEATRIRQWERMVLESADGLRLIKLYRTPQALRSFARLFTVFLPPFYAPSYADIAKTVGSLPVGIIFSILTSLALTALFETISQMEDPFLGHYSLDGVDVEKELSSSFAIQCMTMRAHFFRSARPFDEDHVPSTLREKLPVKAFTMVSAQVGEDVNM